MHADLTVQRYLAGGFTAARVWQCPMTATPMFAVPGAATATAWVNSHIAKANKPGPLGLIGGST